MDLDEFQVLVEKAKIAEQAERYEDMARVSIIISTLTNFKSHC